MDILQRAIQAVQRNLFALALYLVINAAASAVRTTVYIALGPPEQSAYSAGVRFLCSVAVDAFIALAGAVAQAIVFSRFAKDIDRPLWRIDSDREALRRYFVFWLILNGGIMLLKQLVIDVPALFESESEIVFPGYLLLLFAATVYIPFGAAMMFIRDADWRKTGDALAPYGRQFGKIFLICCFSGILQLLVPVLLVEPDKQPWIRLPVDLIMSYFDCVIFCAAWLICMFDRQTPENIDFEF